MDKYTYNVKVDKIMKLVAREDYATAAKIADTMDWEGVKSIRLLTVTSKAYEQLGDYRAAMELLEKALEESTAGKRILYKLTDLALRDRDLESAQQYYEQYLQEAQDDNTRYLLRYRLAELKGEPLDKRIAILETYRKYEFEEEWALRLAELYDQAGMQEACVKLCDEIILWFGVGENVDRAMQIKEKYAALSSDQQDRRDRRDYYEQRYQNVVDNYNGREAARVAAEIRAHAQEQSREAAAPQTPEEAAMSQAAAELEEEYDWTRQFCLVEAESSEMAIEKTLEFMAEYYNARELPMGALTGITAEKLNAIGPMGLRRGCEGKDVLILGAAELSDELIRTVISIVRDERSPQLMILADDGKHIGELDAHLTACVTEQAEAETAAENDVPEEAPETGCSAGLTELNAPAESPWQDRAEEPFVETDRFDEAQEPAFELTPESAPEAEESEPEEPAAQELPEPEPFDEPEQEEIIEPEPVRITEPVRISEPEPAEISEPEPVLPDLCLDDLLRMHDEAEKTAPAPEPAAEPVPAEDTPEIRIAIEEELPTVALATLAAEEAPERIEEEKPAPQPAKPARNPMIFKNALLDQDEEELSRQLNFVFDESEKPAASEPVTPPEPEKAADAAATTVLPRVKREPEARPQNDVSMATQRIERSAVSPSRGDTAPLTSTKHLQKITGMSVEAFTEYALKYIASIDCVMADGALEALQDAVESKRSEDKVLTKDLAEDMIEEAADKAENRKGLFAKRYDRDGNLILRPENFA